MGSIFSRNRVVMYLLCVIDLFTKCVWVKPLKGKKTKIVLHGFSEIVNEFKRKPIKLWVDQGKEFYGRLIKKWSDDNSI